jgi:hypothetical protein
VLRDANERDGEGRVIRGGPAAYGYLGSTIGLLDESNDEYKDGKTQASRHSVDISSIINIVGYSVEEAWAVMKAYAVGADKCIKAFRELDKLGRESVTHKFYRN